MKNKTALPLIIFLSIILFSSSNAQKIDTSLFKGMPVRNIGPAGMSGRIASIDAVEPDHRIIFIGTATGGVWKSTNSGIDWNPVFDNEPVSSIGAVAIYQPNPNIVWVGTGESNIRNSAGVGRGVYKSLDGGKTWNFLGLEKTETISQIRLDPTNPDIAYVAALGTNWGYTQDRGVYKTTDGGKTWNKILYVDDKTGCGDLILDPSNPNKLIASMWQHRRWPWFFKSGGPGSGLYLTIDAGQHWKKITHKDGLPEGELGKIGLAISRNKPNVVYALTEAKNSVLLRSEDGGYNWETVNSHPNVNPRPFYFGRVMVNPVNENLVYRIQFVLEASEDGGKSFHSIQGPIHVDNHALWIAADGEFMIAGNDGGVAISYDRGKTWRFVSNLPLAQFYHISVDNAIPYNVYGGLQDNGSWRGPNTSLMDRGVYNYAWQSIGGGDGFDVKPDPENSDEGYSMSQEGYLMHYNLKSGMMSLIRPTETDVKDRYNWNSAIAIDPFHPATIYYGSQVVHKSTDKGKTWTVISPDLTTNDTTKQKQAESGGLTIDASGAENYTTIIAISPSPIKEGVIWVGTDDGNVQVTQDGGKNWNVVSDNIVDENLAPAGAWVPRLRASKHDPATAYVIMNDYRRNNWSKYVLVTHDYGKSWKNIATKDIDGFALTILEDPVDKNLLFLGSEFGLYFSIDGGNAWNKWTAGLPTVPVMALAFQERENDLIIGTHGRAVYILDDVSALRNLNEKILKEKTHLFTVGEAYEYIFASAGSPPTSWSFSGDTEFRGENEPYGARFTYYINLPDSLKDLVGSKKEKKVSIEIMDSDSTIIRTFKGNMQNGINRAYWDLRRKAFDRPRARSKEGEDRAGSQVLPGHYIVKIKAGDQTMMQGFEVKKDPRFNISDDVLRASYDFEMKLGELSETAAKMFIQIQSTNNSIKTFEEFTTNIDSAKAKDLKTQSKELEKKLVNLMNKITPDSTLTGIQNNSGILMSELGELGWLSYNPSGKPMQNALVKYEKVKKIAEKLIKEYNEIYSKDVPEFQKAVETSGFTIFNEYKKVELK
ncbi:MAG TPA: hypothetical protein VKA26_06450 [Ignavibacteriaceae bacterium]|nr:hypothetical protein [Ignavibacteriaceae bacterium]